MKQLIYSAKQIGDVSYCVDGPEVLFNILDSGRIWLSRNEEFNPNVGHKDHYVSLGRDLTKAIRRNSKRWNCGVIIDGNVLSENYHIEPYSYSGTILENNPQGLRIKYAVSYDDGTYAINFVNWPTFIVSKKLFDFVVTQIDNLSEDIKSKKHFEHLNGAKRRNKNGQKYIDKYIFNVKTGDGGLIMKNAPDWVKAEIQTNDKASEAEERIWAKNYRSINISNSVKGIIVPEIPKSEKDAFMFDKCEQILSNKYGCNNVVTY